MARLRKVLAVVLLVVIIAGLAAGGFLFATNNVLGVDTTLHVNSTNSGDCRGAAATSNTVTQDPSGHFLDQTDYVASWANDLVGQRATFQAAFTNCVFQGLHYKITLTMPGSTPVVVYDSDVPITSYVVIGGWYVLPSSYWDLKSPDGKTIIPEGSYIYAVFSADVGGVLNHGWHDLVSQNSRVHTGIGVTNWEKSQYVVDQDRQACAMWNVGYVTDVPAGRGWSIYITSGAQGYATVASIDHITQLSGRLCYTLTAADFSTSAPKNELVVHLKNELFSKSFDYSTTITKALLATAPSCRINGFDPAAPREGESLTVKFACTAADSKPENQIKLIRVVFGFGGVDDQEDLAADATSFTFALGQAGVLRFEVWAYTQQNVPSKVAKVDIGVEQPLPNGCGPGTRNNTCVPGLELDTTLVLILLVAGLALIVLGRYLPVNIGIRIVMILVGAGMLLLGLYLVAVFLIAWIQQAFPKIPGT